ncbi:hypothetical protein HDZ31DRAFT_29988 [Schizophyllum fasciatum]
MFVLLNRKRTAYARTNRIIATVKTYILQSLGYASTHAHLFAFLLPAHPACVASRYRPLCTLLTGFRHRLHLFYLCSFLSILNTRNHLRRTMDAQDAVAFSNLDVSSSGSSPPKGPEFKFTADVGTRSIAQSVLRPVAPPYHIEAKHATSAFEGHTDS